MGLNAAILSRLSEERLGDMLTLGRQDAQAPWQDATKALAHCGARSVQSLDLANEHPDFVRDLNQPLNDPIPQFDTIFDGGTLEHVFNLPQALINVARMLRCGGTFCTWQLLNLSGHGFYNLSPELLFAWCNANGFANCRCLVRSKLPPRRWREVSWQGRRIELTSILPLEMWFRATKITDVRHFRDPLQAGPSHTNRWKFIMHEARLFRWPAIKSLHKTASRLPSVAQ